MKRLLFLALSLSILSTSCTTSDDPFVEKPNTPVLNNGLIILNEGSFNANNATVGFTSWNYEEYFDNVAKFADDKLGDVAQSMAFKDDKAYVVLNNSNKIEIFHRYNFKHIGSITEGLNQPRYIAFANNKMYVTNQGNNVVSVYNPASNEHITDIAIDGTIDQIHAWNTKLYVQNAAFGVGKDIVVIGENNTIEKKITLEEGLQGMVVLGDFIYAISSNNFKSFFYRINANTNTIVRTFISTMNPEAKNLRLDNNTMYYTSQNKVFNWSTTDINAQENAVVITKDYNEYASFYGFNVINNVVYTANAGDFVNSSTITIYDLKGKEIKSFKGGVATNNFYANFKH